MTCWRLVEKVEAVLPFLHYGKIKSREAQNVLESMHKLHKSGHLNEHIRCYHQLQGAGRITDPAPSHSTNILELV
ncbi:hypothetical protein PC116_g18617 [Phytophthora cactorum]|nr:hypothetical protein PC116_g18617 [Phytophthora cactorum]